MYVCFKHHFENEQLGLKKRLRMCCGLLMKVLWCKNAGVEGGECEMGVGGAVSGGRGWG